MAKQLMHRDVRCANDVAEMIRLGRFEKEFIVYGAAMQNMAGEITYYVTSNEERLQKYINSYKWNGCFFTPITTLVKRTVAPAGMENDIIHATKLSLLGEMKRSYKAVDYFSNMQPFFQLEANDEAYTCLANYQRQLEGHFDERALQLFLNAVKIAYEGKVLSISHYKEFIGWYQYMKRQMEDDPVVADNIERTLYGFVYYENNQQKIAYDAQELCVLHQQYEKQMAGLIVAPIMHKTYWFHQFKQMKEVREAFCNWLKEGQDEKYFSLLNTIKTKNGVINEQALETVKKRFSVSKLAYEACQYYEGLWNKQQ